MSGRQPDLYRFEKLHDQGHPHGQKDSPCPGYHVLVIPSWFPTPAEPLAGTFCLDQVKAVRSQGHRVGVLFPEFRNLRALRHWHRVLESHFQFSRFTVDNIPLYLFNGWALPKTLAMQSRLYVKAVEKMFRTYVSRFDRPDLIHAHGALWGGHAAGILSDRYQIPWMVTEHYGAFIRGTIGAGDACLARNVWQSAAKVTAVGSVLAGLIKKQISRADVHITPNPVDVGLFRRPGDGKQNYGPARAIQVFSLGRLVPGKGFRLLLKSFARAFKDPNYKLDIGGDGYLQPELKRLANRLGLSRQVRFLGPLSRMEVAAAFARADFFVHASASETFGVVMLEALASGIPVVACRSGGPDDFITPECGYLVSPGDADALASRMVKVSQNLSAWKMKRDQISKYAADQYGYTPVGRLYTRLYREIMNKTGKHRGVRE